VIGFALEASYPLLVKIRIAPLDLSCSGLWLPTAVVADDY
jgi:hypothetical protein